MKSICGVALAVAGCLNPVCHAELNPQAIAFNCLNCHAAEPESGSAEIPSLIGLSAAQLTQALLDFKYEKKSATLMPRLVKGYSDAELAAVASYLSRR